MEMLFCGAAALLTSPLREAARPSGVPAAGGGGLYSGTDETTAQAAGCARAWAPTAATTAATTAAAMTATTAATTVAATVATMAATTAGAGVGAPAPAPEASGSGPSARGLLGCLAAPADLPGLPDPKTLLGLLGAWHGRGVQVGFPELTGRRPS